MAHKILLPTDFSIESLNVLKHYLQKSSKEAVLDVVLVHGQTLSDSISDLLFFSKYRILKELNIEHFEDAVKILQNKYDSKLRNVHIDIFTGHNQSAFENYLSGNRIDEIILSEQLPFKPHNKKSFDITKYALRAETPVTKLNCEQEIPKNADTADISSLFNNNVALSR